MKKLNTTLFQLALIVVATMAASGAAQAVVLQDWATRFGVVGSGGNSVAVDPAGNVYVAGTVYRGIHGFDFVTIKYDPAGTEMWSREFNGIGNDLDYPVGIALTSDGNVVVTGASVRGPATLNFEIVTRAYSPAGDSLWLARWNGVSSREDRPLALAVDGSGNTYVCGYANGTSLSSNAGRAFVTIKYGPTGAQLWAATLPMTYGSGASAIAVDQQGRVYVTGGGSEGNPTFGDCVTIKYTAAGSAAWVSRYGGTAQDEGKAIAVDDSGSVYVTGTGGDLLDIATIKYDSTGVQRWAKLYDGAAHNADVGIGIGIDAAHNVYVTGRETNFNAANNRDIVTMKYTTTGDSLWVARYDGPGGSYDEPVAIRVDGAGNSVVLGSSYGAYTPSFNSFLGYATMAYGPGGNALWLVRYDGPGDGDESPVALAVAADGSVYVTGFSTDYLSGNAYAATVKYRQGALDVAGDGRPGRDPARLSWNHPNPCSRATTIEFDLPAAARVSLKVYDLQGREVATLADDLQPAGAHAVRWDTSAAPYGVYFYRLRAGDHEETRRMVVIR